MHSLPVPACDRASPEGHLRFQAEKVCIEAQPPLRHVHASVHHNLVVPRARKVWAGQQNSETAGEKKERDRRYMHRPPQEVRRGGKCQRQFGVNTTAAAAAASRSRPKTLTLRVGLVLDGSKGQQQERAPNQTFASGAFVGLRRHQTHSGLETRVRHQRGQAARKTRRRD